MADADDSWPPGGGAQQRIQVPLGILIESGFWRALIHNRRDELPPPELMHRCSSYALRGYPYPAPPIQRINLMRCASTVCYQGVKSFFTGCFYSQSPCPAIRSYCQSSRINTAGSRMHTRGTCEPL